VAENSKIEWTHHTVNLWWGCVEVSPGCDHCYARVLAERWGRNVWGVHAPRWFTKAWRKTLKDAQRIGEETCVRQRVFCQSMSDIAEILGNHESAGQMNDLRAELFEEWVPKSTMLDFQFLTKRIGNVSKIVPAAWLNGSWPINAWQGISVVNQTEADRDIPKLLAIPASIRFLSVEPMLGPVDLTSLGVRSKEHAYGGESAGWNQLEWIICGGESGAKKRAMDFAWARSLRDQCNVADVPFFMKQIDKVQPIPDDLLVREFPA